MVFKGCGRCGGDMYREEDISQTELVCLQCGYRTATDRPVVSRIYGSARRNVRARRRLIKVAA